MTNDEIYTSYRGAADPAAQIRIISDLSLLDTGAVEAILRAGGFEVPNKIPKLACRGEIDRRPSRRWTQGERETLANLAEQGLNCAEIAYRIDRPQSVVRTKCKEIGVKIQSAMVTKAAREMLKKAAAEGLTIKQAASRAGIAESNARAAAIRLSLEFTEEESK